MIRVHSLRFDALEGKTLLSSAHVAAPRPASTQVATPLGLDGTLTVEMDKATQITNLDSSVTTNTPVSGRLGTLGKVQGTWSNSQDQFGDYLGPDTIRLQVVASKGSTPPKGTFTIDFNGQDTGKATMVGHGIGFYQHAERLGGGTGVFARDAENGSIQVFVNPSKHTVQDMELISTNTDS